MIQMTIISRLFQIQPVYAATCVWIGKPLKVQKGFL